MTSTMAKLQDRLKDVENILLVSFSVDPERDTPQELREYAEFYKVSPSRWLFLAGDEGEVDYLAREGFHLAVAADTSSEVEPFVHSTMFVLVDRQGVIRGYFDSNEPEFHEKILLDARILASEKN